MASIYEKTPFFKVHRTWDTKTVFPATYKLQSNDFSTKQKVEIFKDDGRFGAEFLLDRTISDFILGANTVNLGYPQSFTEFGNVLQGAYLTDWKQVCHAHFPEPIDSAGIRPEQDRSVPENFQRAIDLFLVRTLKEQKPRDRQYIYLAPGGDYGIHKDLLTSPLDHLHRFQEMLRISELLPAGDIPPPNAALQVEWFYMSFHKSDRSEYVRSGRKLSDETLDSLAEYFEAIFNAKLSDGSLQKKREEQIRRSAQHDLRKRLEERYKEKLRAFADSRKRGHSTNRSWHRERDGHKERGTYKSHKEASTRGDRKTLPEGSSKKPCHLHGPQAQHSYDECRQNPANRSSERTPTKFAGKKREHEAHYHDDRHHGSSEESGEDSVRTRTSSEAELSENGSAEGSVRENYHLECYHIPKKSKAGFLAGKTNHTPGSLADLSHEPENLEIEMGSQSVTKAESRMDSPLNLNLEGIFADDVTMGLSYDHDSLDAFKFGN